MKKNLAERNQVLVGLVGIAATIAVVMLALNLKSPFGSGDHEYRALFANAGHLKAGDSVRLMGVNVGSIESVRIKGTAVEVAFTISGDDQLGGQSRASIEVGTVLGTMFLQIASSGPGRLEPGGTIPLSRTTVPYTLNDVLQATGGFSKGTDSQQLGESFSQLATALGGISNRDAHDALRGIASVSGAIGDQQDQLADLVTSASKVIGTLNSHSGDIAAILGQSNTFLADMNRRQDAINRLLTSTRALATQVAALVAENGSQLGSLLKNLDTVADVLATNQDKLTHTIGELGNLAVNLANATGSGPWVDVYNPTGLVPDTIVAGCGVHPDTSKGPCAVDR